MEVHKQYFTYIIFISIGAILIASAFILLSDQLSPLLPSIFMLAAFLVILAIIIVAKKNKPGTATLSPTELDQRKKNPITFKQFKSSFIESKNLWINTLDKEGNVVLWNSGAEEISGYKYDEVAGTKDIWTKLYPEEDYRNSIFQKAKKIISGELEIVGFETIIISKTGSKKTILWDSKYLLDEKGDITGSIAIGKDITSEKTIKNELNESLQKYKGLYETAGDAILVLRDGKIIDCNPGTAVMFRCGKENIIGMTPVNISPETQPNGSSSKEQALLKIKAAIHEGGQFFEWKHKRFDGSLFDAEIKLTLLEYSGNRLIQATVRDITARKQAIAALKDNEQKLQSVFNYSPVGILHIDKDGTAVSYNKKYTEIMGIESEQIVGFNILKDHPSQEIKDALKTMFTEGSGSFEGSYTSIFSSKSVFIKGQVNAIKDKSDRIIGGVAIIEDITERKQAEIALRDSEEKFRSVFDYSPVGIFHIDNSGTVINCNRKFEELMGSPLSKLQEINILDNENEGVVYAVKQMFKTGNGSYEGKYNSRITGKTIPVRGQINAIKDINGKTIGGVGIIEDITESYQAREALQKQNAYYNGLIEKSPAAISLLSTDGTVLRINEKFRSLFGYTQLEAVGQNIQDLIVPEHCLEESVDLMDYETLMNDKARKTTVRHDKSGKLIDVSIIGAPIIINDRLEGIYGMYIDFRKEKEYENNLVAAKEKAEIADKLKSEFLAQMSHEIRTPINTILSFSSLIREDIETHVSDELSMCFRGIDNAGKRITRTIDLILNMSEIQTGSYDFHPKKLNICDDILNILYTEYLLPAKEKGLKLILEKNDNLPEIIADEYTLSQIIANLVDNAIKYTERGGITINCDKDKDNRILLEISDTGIGISEDYLPKVFDAFSQEYQGYTRKFEGNGLGLALVKKYCDMNNINISVDSKKDSGTTFKLTFNSSDS